MVKKTKQAKRKRILIISTILLSGIIGSGTSCNTNSSSESDLKQSKVEVKTEVKTAVGNAFSDVTGNYVTEDYFKRSEGYDWLVVSAEKITDSTINIKVRSRIDKKKATCSFAGIGKRVIKDAYEVTDRGSTLRFTFKNNMVEISGKGGINDEVALTTFCSGGANLSKYIFTKLGRPLDDAQLLENNK